MGIGSAAGHLMDWWGGASVGRVLAGPGGVVHQWAGAKLQLPATFGRHGVVGSGVGQLLGSWQAFQGRIRSGGDVQGGLGHVGRGSGGALLGGGAGEGGVHAGVVGSELRRLQRMQGDNGLRPLALGGGPLVPCVCTGAPVAVTASWVSGSTRAKADGLPAHIRASGWAVGFFLGGGGGAATSEDPPTHTPGTRCGSACHHLC